ncbi:MAG: D-amino-acid dehydrogenase [Ulvibacter sp.]
MKTVTIIGGGIIGLSSAYFLLKEGFEVTVIDKSNISSGASFVNAGYISPSHIIPLAAPGRVAQGIKYMFDSSSPFYMKPRLNKDFLKWAWLFQKSCSKKNVEKSAQSILDLTLLSQSLFKEIYASGDVDFHLEHKGLLMAFQTESSKYHEEEVVARASKMGLQIEYLDQKALAVLEPNLIAEGAFHYHSDSHTTPKLFMDAMKHYLQKNGVKLNTNEEVLHISPKEDKVEITTSLRSYVTDEVVIATGSWSENMAKKLGVYLPVQAGKGYCINTDKLTGIKHPTIIMEANAAVTPMSGFTRFAGTMEIAGLDETIRKERVEAIAAAAQRFYKDLEFSSEEKGKATFGFRPVSPDGVPFIGKLKKHRNITIATGHAMMGWSLGPGTGKIISEIITNKQPSISLERFSPERF